MTSTIPPPLPPPSCQIPRAGYPGVEVRLQQRRLVLLLEGEEEPRLREEVALLLPMLGLTQVATI